MEQTNACNTANPALHLGILHHGSVWLAIAAAIALGCCLSIPNIYKPTSNAQVPHPTARRALPARALLTLLCALLLLPPWLLFLLQCRSFAA